MKVLLIKNVPKLGKKGEIKNVNPGYARNFLIAKELAKMADRATIGHWQAMQKHLVDDRILAKEKIEALKNKIDDIKIEIKANKNEKGHLFAQIKPLDINKELKKYKIEVPESKIIMPNIKEVGEYKIKIELSDQVIAKFYLSII